MSAVRLAAGGIESLPLSMTFLRRLALKGLGVNVSVGSLPTSWMYHAPTLQSLRLTGMRFDGIGKARIDHKLRARHHA
jgi:hypothetical protein